MYRYKNAENINFLRSECPSTEELLPSTSTEERPRAVSGRGTGDETAVELWLTADGSSISISLAELGGRDVNGFSEY